jgi:tRNA (cytidine/uridine-2'-O-)-methyltransferase
MGESIDTPQRSVCRGLFRWLIGCGILNDMFSLILYEPEIPPNTGNIIRLCANTGVDLHLVEPLGFELDEPRLRRAGLDYREFAKVRTHASLEDALATIGDPRVFALSTRGNTRYDAPRYRAGDVFLMGPETRGLPQALLDSLPEEQRLRLPMRAGNRSLNLSNAAAVVVYEAWRQLDFEQGS